MNSWIVRKDEMLQKLETRRHPLDPSSVREAVSLGDLTGLSTCGIHLTVLKPGMVSTVQHSHQFADEFIYILSGRGKILLDDEETEISAGDFVGMPAKGPSHSLRNSGNADLVYLIGGNRPVFDVCDYPKRNERVYLYFAGDKRTRDFVKIPDVDSK